MPWAKYYPAYSYWLESCGDDLTPRPALDGSVDVDVAILGAGYSGLWTAYYLLKRDPTLKVAIAEKEIAGFGASGRNGGWCSSGFPMGLDELGRRFGDEAARDLQLAMIAAVDEVGLVAEEEGIDADYEKGGALRFARGKHQVPLIERSLETYRRFGLDGHYQLLDAGEAMDRVNVQGAIGALFTPHCATIHPGKLARGLARVVERRGATIYEQTAVSSYVEGAIRPAYAEGRHPRQNNRPGWGELPVADETAQPPADPHLLPDRPHAAPHRRPVGRDRLARQGVRLIEPAYRRLSVTHH